MIPQTAKEITSELVGIFGGEVIPPAYPNRRCCNKCGAKAESYSELDRHHITYKPKNLVWLCHPCHVRITYLNRRKARSLYRKLNNEDRWEVWDKFTKEETSPRQYKRSVCGTKDWFG